MKYTLHTWQHHGHSWSISKDRKWAIATPIITPVTINLYIPDAQPPIYRMDVPFEGFC